MDKAIEQWRPVHLPEFADLYEVSDQGRVRRRATGRIVCSSASGLHRGLQLKLRFPNGNTKNVMVSHLVMGAFVEDSRGRIIAFRDKNARNYAPSNLYFLKNTPTKRSASANGQAAKQLGNSIEKIISEIWKDLLH